MMPSVGLVILGCGGQARTVADVALAGGIKEILFLDENACEGEQMLGFPVKKDLPGMLPQGWRCIPGSGNNSKREIQIRKAQTNGWPVASIVAPSAIIGTDAVVSSGVFIGHHASVGPKAEIGIGCIINTGAIISHDCKVGNFTHISVNATVAGKAIIGSYCFIGAGSIVIDGVSICSNTVIGAGGVAVRPIQEAGTYVGVPVTRKVRC